VSAADVVIVVQVSRVIAFNLHLPNNPLRLTWRRRSACGGL
jgi:hypothetical protein